MSCVIAAKLSVRSLQRIDDPTPHGAAQAVVLARFDVRLGGLDVEGCALAQSSRGTFVWPPRVGSERPVNFSRNISDQIRKLVFAELRAMGDPS